MSPIERCRAACRRGVRGAALASALVLTACGATTTQVWVDEVSSAELGEAAAGDYLIATGDLLAVRVYEQDAVSTRGRVRPDGKISVPLAGEVRALRRRPAELAREIEALLKPFVRAPTVSVIVEEIQPVRVSVLGEVARPGVFVLDPGAGVLQALASAGGTTEFAARDRIFVVRRMSGGAPIRIRFSLAKLTGDSRAAGFMLTQGDVVMVE